MTNAEPTHLQKTTQAVKWRSPSNIAIVKYWGKKGTQEPVNPSISMTLNSSYTETEVQYAIKTNESDLPFQFLFDNVHQPAFEEKIKQFFAHIFRLYPELESYKFNINSINSFPHSAGIASSASAMSALAFSMIDIHNKITNQPVEFDPYFVSHLARLGSGSACRSIVGGWNLWGEYNELKGSSNLHSINLNETIHPIFKDLRDTILIIDSGKKAISSSKGHRLMANHPYRENRIEQAYNNIAKLLSILKTGDLNEFCLVAEAEALSLHALMMSSNPGYFLLHENTIKAIELIRQFRSELNIPLCFTLDAGPNLHLLYPNQDHEKVATFISHVLLPLCEDGQTISDYTGNGPEKLL